MPEIAAFPLPEYREYVRNEEQCGMSLRDYFAAKAIAGLLTAPPYQKTDFQKEQQILEKLCDEAWTIADEMIKQRKNNEG